LLLQQASEAKFLNIKHAVVDHYENIEIVELIVIPNSVKHSIKYFYWFFEIFVIISRLPGFFVQHKPNEFCLWNRLARRVTELVLLSFMERVLCPISYYGVNDLANGIFTRVACPPGPRWNLLWLSGNYYHPFAPNLNGHSTKEVYKGYKQICDGFSQGKLPLQLLFNVFRQDPAFEYNHTVNHPEMVLVAFLTRFREKYRFYAQAKGMANNFGTFYIFYSYFNSLFWFF
jgi:hypothetical protein